MALLVAHIPRCCGKPGSAAEFFGKNRVINGFSMKASARGKPDFRHGAGDLRDGWVPTDRRGLEAASLSGCLQHRTPPKAEAAPSCEGAASLDQTSQEAVSW
jgi:hypothetical protein